MASLKTMLRPQPLRAIFNAAAVRPQALAPPSLTTSSTTTNRTTTMRRTSRLPTAAAASFSTSSRLLSGAAAPASPAATTTTTKPEPLPLVPAPTPFVPDVATFLKLIGRNLSIHAQKFPTWDSLFSLTAVQLAELGVEPPRSRKYLLRWRQRFRRGQFGIGGDLQHVSPEGAADLRVLEATRPGHPVHGRRKLVVNVPPGTPSDSPAALEALPLSQMSRVTGYRVRGASTIVGPYALPLKTGAGVPGAARVTVTEGMWEDRQGRKIDGGERRRTEIRYKKRIAERRELREKGLLK